MPVPFVLGCAADQHGCGFHRIQSPAYWLAKHGVALANAVLGYPPLDKLREMKPDVIVCQRPRDERELHVIRDIRKEFGHDIKIIFEIDDLLTDVPAQNVHEPYQPPSDEVDINIGQVLDYCDWAIASSAPIAEWLHRLNPKCPIKVMNNFLLEADSDDLPKIEVASGKPKIGWGGSISHDGDLEFLVKAVEEIPADKISWTFLGHYPPANFDGKDITKIPGVPPHQYFPLLASQGLELMLAPLEDNAFNEAKTNLKIVQAGLVGAAVIATPLRCYTDDAPPVFAYATTASEYKEKIQEWLSLSEKKKIWHRARMRQWAKNYGVRHNLHIIQSCWGVTAPDLAHMPKKINGDLVVAAAPNTVILGEKESVSAIFEPNFSVATKLAIKLSAPLLVASVGTAISDQSLEKLRDALQSDTAASAFPMSNDGGMGISFLSIPNNPAFATLDYEASRVCEHTCLEAGLPNRVVPFSMGPAVLLSPKALVRIAPSADQLWDWGFLASLAGLQNIFVPSAWAVAAMPQQPQNVSWLEIRGLNPFFVQGALTVMERIVLEAKFVKNSTSFIVGTTPGDAATWADVFQPQDTCEAESVRIIKYYEGPININEINERWVRYEDERTEIRQGIDAKMEKFGDENIADIVYCDAFGPKSSHFFKPATFDLDYFLALDYISGCCLIRTETLKLLLSKTEKKTINSRLELFGFLLGFAKVKAKFSHLNYIGYVEREQPADDGRVQIVQHMFADYTAKKLDAGLLSVERKLIGAPPKVSIMILTTGKTWTLRQCLATLLRRTDYQGEIEILLGRMGTNKGNPKSLKETNDPRIRIFELGETFNWSKGNNLLAEQATGDIFLFMNDDILVSDKEWLTKMMAYAIREDVGAVGIRLVYPQNGAVQHIGVYTGSGIAGHILKGLPPQSAGYWGIARVTHEATAVTGACLAVKKHIYQEIKGFREDMPVNYNDVAFCIESRKLGYKNICVCTKEMMHAESSSRPHAFTPEWAQSSCDLNSHYPDFVDPYWNKSLRVTYNVPKWTVGGLNYDNLDWNHNWSGVALMLNGIDAEEVIRLAQKGVKPILATTEKGRLMFIRPALMNAPSIEVGEKTLITDVLKAFNVNYWYTVNHTPECDIVKKCFDTLSET